MLNKLRNELASLKAQQDPLSYWYDGYEQYRDRNAYFVLQSKIDKVEEKIALYEQFEGDPMEWKANGDSISECQKCPHNEKCKRWNNYINRPARKRFDQNGDVIEYDKTGNLKYQVLNLKGEQR